MVAEKYVIESGFPYPMGAVPMDGGVNFALFSGNAEKVELCLFDGGNRETRLVLPSHEGTVFYGFVRGIDAGQRYGYRAYGSSSSFCGLKQDSTSASALPYTR